MDERRIAFITDSNLGKLAKWLRILGYDTLLYRGNIDRSFLKEAQKAGRVALTRKKDMAKRQFSGKLIVIQQDRLENQLAEIIDNLSLNPKPDQILTLCLMCNEQLKVVSREELPGMVPDYVFERQTKFYLCSRCGGIFWPGTHRENMDRFITTRIQSRHP